MSTLGAAAVNLHMHTWGDCAVHQVLDVDEEARKQHGRPLHIRVTLAHVNNVDPVDIARFSALDVGANFTTFWFGTPNPFAEYLDGHLGPLRSQRQWPMGSIMRAGGNVSTGSDIIGSSKIPYAAPLIGLQVSVT